MSLHAETISALEGSYHTSGNIYAVVAVITVILLGLFVYLIRLDRKLGRLEQDLKEKA
jgi:CcmD family protein